MSDVKTVLSDAEELLKQAASTTGEKAAELRERGMGLLKQARKRPRICRMPSSPRARPPRVPPTTTCTITLGAPWAWPPVWAC